MFHIHEKIGPRLAATAGGWHILDHDGKSFGFINRIKGFDHYTVTLRGTAAEIRQVIDSGIIKSVLTLGGK